MKRPETLSNHIVESLTVAAAKLYSYGVPVGQAEVIVGTAAFDRLKTHVDVASRKVTLTPQMDPGWWTVKIVDLGMTFNLFVTQDVDHRCNKAE